MKTGKDERVRQTDYRLMINMGSIMPKSGPEVIKEVSTNITKKAAFITVTQQ